MFICSMCNKNKSNKIYKNGECHDCYMGNRKLTCSNCSANHSARWYKGNICQNCYIKKNNFKLKKNNKTCVECNTPLLRRDKRNRCAKCFSKSIRDTPKARYSRALSHAKRRKLDFNISKHDYFELLKKSCYYCSQFKLSSGVGLDRINNNFGYTLDNVLPSCGECNVIRGINLTVDETKFVITKLQEYRRNKEEIS